MKKRFPISRGHWFTVATGVFLVLLPGLLGSVAQVRDVPATEGSPGLAQLTAAEQDWLAENRVLRVGVDPFWPPFSIRNMKGDRGYQGIDPQLLDELSEALGVEFKIVDTSSWEETHEMLKAGELDLAMGTTRTSEREKWAHFTQPYLETPVAIVMRHDAPFSVRLRDLTGLTAAAPEGYVTTGYLEEVLPDLPIQKTETVEEALMLVSRGKADFMLGNLVTTSYLIRQRGMSNLKIAGIAEERFAQHLAVRRGAPQLASILDKGLQTIPEEKMNKILENWIPVEVDEMISWQKARTLAGRLALLALLILGGFSIWNFFLAREVNERKKVERDLREAKARLEELNQEKDNLMGMVAHDLNSPLTQVRLVTEILDGHINKEDPEATMLLESLGDSVQRMESLTRRLLQMHAAEQQARAENESSETDLRLTVLEIEKRHTPAAAIKDIAIAQEWDPETSFVVRVTPDVCDQIFDNLLSNAIKYTALETTVTIELKKEGEQVLGIIHDQGPGVQPGERKKLFQKFTRLSAQPTGGETSTGLGLSIVKHLCDLVGGEVRCESDGKSGCRFIVSLPGV